MNTRKNNKTSPSQELSQQLFCKDSVQDDQSQERDIFSSKTLYAEQSIQETAAVVFVSTAAEFMPQYEVDSIEVFSWGFRISFLQDIVGGDRLLTVLEEEMRRKLKRLSIESHAMLASLVPAFLKSRKVTFLGDLQAEGVIDFALIDSIAVEICHQDVDGKEILDTSAVQHFLLFASHNYIEGFVALDKTSFKVLRQKWKEEYSKNGSGLLSSWVSDPGLTQGIPAPTFKLQFAKMRLETMCSLEAEKRGYSALFDIALDQLNFQEASKEKKSLFITTDLSVSQDPLLWDLPVSKAALFLTFLDESHFEFSVQKLLKNEVSNLLALFKNLSGMKISASLSRGGKSLHRLRSQLVTYLKAGSICEVPELDDSSAPLSEALFFPGELCLEFSLEDYRLRTAPLGYLRVGRVPLFQEQKGRRGAKREQGAEGREDSRGSDTLYVAFVPFYGLERIIALLLDHSRGYLPQELAFKNLVVTGKNADEIAKICLRSGLRSEVMHGKFDRVKEYAAQNGIRFVSAADHNRNDILNVDHSEVESSTFYVYDISNGQRNLVHTPDELVRLIMASVPAGMSADTGNRAL